MKKKEISSKSKVKSQTFVGVVDHVSPSYAFVVVSDKDKDIKVQSKFLSGAFHGDKVLITLKGKGAIVTKILNRSKDKFVGVLKSKQNYYVVHLDGKRMHNIVYIEANKLLGAKIDDKVIINIYEWSNKLNQCKGKVIKVLGPSGSYKTELSSILFEYNLSQNFSKKVNDNIQILENKRKKISQRKDFRNITTFTIDPTNAKDYDDALSVKKLSNNNFEIGVHIADVSHYVIQNSVIDEEARKRGNTVYLVNQTIPMLPEVISNNICSLVPEKDRLTFSVIFELTPQGKVVKSWIGECIINSNKRFTYSEAQQILNDKQGIYYEELAILNKIAINIKKQRIKKGSIEFHSPDISVDLDAQGYPTKIEKKQALQTNYLIEEYMLLANKEVTLFINRLKQGNNINIDFIYRVHDNPEKDKVNSFLDFVNVLGYKLPKKVTNLEKIFFNIKEHYKGKKEESIVNYFGIRTMSKALYSKKNIGHYGLGFENYTHFTSPIRRYADLMVHRLLKKYLKNNLETTRDIDFENLCKHISITEKKAMEAERISIKVNQMIFLEKLQNRVHKGMISYIGEKNIYVELLEYGCEGFIPFSRMADDFYFYNSKKFCAIGRNTKKVYKLGDLINVKVSKIKFADRLVEFKISN